MITSNSLPTTLTEAQARARYSVCVVGSYSTQSTSRFISYAEIYQGRSGMMEPPLHYLQKALEQERQKNGEET